MASEEDLTPDSLQDGSIQTSAGSNNVLVVAPNLTPDGQAGRYIAWFGFRLMQMMGGYGVVNCRRYRLPVPDDPLPEELRIPDGSSKDKQHQQVLALRKRLLKETRGIPVDLDSYSAASLAAPDYVESIWLAACGIGWKAEPLVLFVQGVDDATADKFDFDVAIGAGCVTNKEQAPNDDDLTIGADLVDELLRGLHLSRPDLRTCEGVQGFALESRDHVAWWLRSVWNDRHDPASDDSWRAPNVNCLLLTLRCSGLRKGMMDCERTGWWLRDAIKNLSTFRALEEEKKPAAKKTGKRKERTNAVKAVEPPRADESSDKRLEPEVLPSDEVTAVTNSGAQGKHVKKSTIDDGLVRETLDFIREKTDELVYKGSIEIGDYILEKFFDGDIERAKSKKPTKRLSYIALCRHQELVVHPATLGIMVRVAAQEKFFERKKLPADKLSYSHKAELVKLEDDQEKVKLFKEAVSKSLSVRDLADRVKQSKSSGRTSSGPNLLSGKRGVFNPEVLLKNPVLSDENKLRELKPEDLKGLLSEVTEALDRLVSYTVEYNRIRKRLETIAQEGAEKHSV